MIAALVKRQTEQYADFIARDEPFNQQLNNGTLSPESFSTFLFNIEYLIDHTPIHLKLAIGNSSAEPALQKYFKDKYEEEQGHNKWAIDDRNKVIDKVKDPTFYPTITKEMRNYVKEIEAIVDHDVRLYIVYIFYTEYLTVLVAERMKRGLTICGFGNDPIDVITKHAELDVHHTSEGEIALQTFSSESADWPDKVSSQLSKLIELHTLMWKSCLV